MLCPRASLGKAPLACVYNANFTGESGQSGASSNSIPLSLFDLQNNQVLGIGSGSTIVHAVQRLGRVQIPFLSLPPQKVPFSICPNYLKNTLNHLHADLKLTPQVYSPTAVSCLKLKVKAGCWAPNLLPESPEEVMICHLFSPHSQEKRSTGTHHKLELSSLVWFQLCPALPSADLLCGSGPCSCSASFNPFACGSFCSPHPRDPH